MLRILALLVLLFGLFSFVKVGFKHFYLGAKPGEKGGGAPQEFWEIEGHLLSYPTAALTRWDHLVKSPFSDTLLNVSQFAPGELVRCGTTNKPFYVPYRHDLQYGDIVGHWTIQRFEQSGTIDYDVRIKANLQGFTGDGKRLRLNGVELAPEEQWRITFKSMRFSNDFLDCEFEEQFSQNKIEQGKFHWQFSSAQSMLQGTAILADGQRSVVSEGRRYAGSRGNIPPSVKSPDALIPVGWRKLDTISGTLTASGGTFFVTAAEESGANPRRWLIIAQRDGKTGDCQTVLATSYACRDRSFENQADPFHGLSLPNQDPKPRPGEFVLRHHLTLDSFHQGEDLWFRYMKDNQEWRFVEGRQYDFELKANNKELKSWPLKPGVSLAEFRIDQLQRENDPQQTPKPPSNLPSAPVEQPPYAERPDAGLTAQTF